MQASQQKTIRVIPESYMHITYEMRRKLIHLVQEEKATIPESCKILGIKKSTAKSILRQFRRKGKIFRRKCEKKAYRKKVEVPAGAINVEKQSKIPEIQSQNSSSKIEHSSQENCCFDINQFCQIQQAAYWVPAQYYYPIMPNYNMGFF